MKPANTQIVEDSLLLRKVDFTLMDIGYARNGPWLHSPLDRPGNLFLKRVIDFTIGSILLVLLAVLLPLIALAIKLDSKGPVLFRQKRFKRNAKLFTCYKFRTMHENHLADERAACINDLRITKVGKFLRAHHLDELPQLWNVVMGDMSLIGPRPYMIKDSERYRIVINDYLLRYKVKPGITGLSQLLGYGGEVSDHNIRERTARDIHYVKRWSLLLDFSILVKTMKKMAGICAR